MRRLTPLILLALLSGCSTHLSKLKELNPAAEDFKGALAAEYRDFADSEAEQGRRSVADRFARKGLDSYHGKEVLPDTVGAQLPQESQAELAEARSQLMRLETDGVKDAAPLELAHAQLLFDCWQQQVADKIEPEKALCKPEFSTSLTRLLEKAGPEVFGKAYTWRIEFAPNVTRLSDDNRVEIDDVACELTGLKDYWVELRAYVGRKASQRKLTEARIAAVKKALVNNGVPSRQIRTHREGGRGVVLSRDNIPQNTKVVTITISAEPQRAKEAK